MNIGHFSSVCLVYLNHGQTSYTEINVVRNLITVLWSEFMNNCSADKFFSASLLFYDNKSSYNVRLYLKATAHYIKLLKMATSLWGFTGMMIVVDMIAAIFLPVESFGAMDRNRTNAKDKTICLIIEN